MGTLVNSALTVLAALGLGLACGLKEGAIAPDEQTKFQEGESRSIFGSLEPTKPVVSQDDILGVSPGEDSNDSTQGNVSTGSDQQTPAEAGPPSPDTNTPPLPAPSPAPTATPPAPPPPAPFYPASCAEIKKAKPDATSGVFKIYPHAAAEQRVGIDASCDMTEDGGGWTLILNYSHKGGTNPELTVRTTDLPLLGGDTLGVDESLPANARNWGHAANSLLANFTVKDLRFFCRSAETPRVLHFKTDDPSCITAAQKGTGSCEGVKNSFTRLTGHTGTLPEIVDTARADAGDFALTRETFQDGRLGRDTSWSLHDDQNAWECDFGSNDFEDDTIHRIWFR